jgi:hypothetical protein
MTGLAQMSLPELVGAGLGLVFTLFVFSYIFGDNALFRIAMSIFVGVASAFAGVVAWYNVIWPQLLRPLIFGNQSERLFILIPLFFGGLLLLKVSPRFSRLGNPAMAFMVGVGVAAAIGGAVLGTIFPQISATVNLFGMDTVNAEENVIWQLARGGMILIGTLTTLIYFQFGAVRSKGRSAARPEWLEWLGIVGQVFIAITFGALFAGVFSASLTALIERLYFVVNFVLSLF